MPNDNQAAKSYIEAVMARADGATEGPWDNYYGGRQTVHTKVPASSISAVHIKIADCLADNKHRDGDFIAAARQDIPTLAKIALRAIAALEERAKALTKESDNAYNGESYQLANMLQCEADYCTQALADINALAAKGS